MVLWALGMVSSYTMGGFIDLLLVVAIIMVLVNVISGRKAVLKVVNQQKELEVQMNSKTIAVILIALGIVMPE